MQHTYCHRTTACTCSHTAIKNRNAHTHRSCAAIQHTLTLVWDVHHILTHCQTYANLNMQLKTKQAAHAVLHRSQTGSTPTHTLLQHTAGKHLHTPASPGQYDQNKHQGSQTPFRTYIQQTPCLQFVLVQLNAKYTDSNFILI